MTHRGGTERPFICLDDGLNDNDDDNNNNNNNNNNSSNENNKTCLYSEMNQNSVPREPFLLQNKLNSQK